MSRLAKPLTAALLLALVAAPANAQFPWWGKKKAPAPEVTIQWMDDPSEALAAAAQSGKPILAYFTSDHCGYCRKMDKETWSTPAVGRLVGEGFVPLRLHADEHPDEVAALRVRAFPTTVLISPEGKAFAGKPGFLEPLELAEFVRPALARRDVAATR